MTSVLHSVVVGDEFKDAIVTYWIVIAALLLAMLWVVVKLKDKDDEE